MYEVMSMTGQFSEITQERYTELSAMNDSQLQELGVSSLFKDDFETRRVPNLHNVR